jgi:hypothetical protein
MGDHDEIASPSEEPDPPVDGGAVRYDAEKQRYEPNPAAVVWQREGTTWGDVSQRLFTRRQLCEQRQTLHDQRAERWTRIATPLAWLTAVLAAVSGLSIVADYSVAAVILSIATAFVAATNAALNPADAARSNKAAATAYGKLGREIDDYAYFEIRTLENLIPEDRLETVRESLTKMEDELSAIEESHPPPASPTVSMTAP